MNEFVCPCSVIHYHPFIPTSDDFTVTSIPFGGGGISAAKVAMCATNVFKASADPCCTDRWKLVRSQERAKGSALAANSLAGQIHSTLRHKTSMTWLQLVRPGDSLWPVRNAGVHQWCHRVRIHSVRRETLGQQHLEWFF